MLYVNLIAEMRLHTRGSCKFPNFLIHQERWRDLTGMYRLDIEDGLKVIRIRDRVRTNPILYNEYTGNSVTRVVFRCVQNLERTIYGNVDVVTAAYIAFTTNDEW